METKILNISISMFLKLGFKSVTMDDIAKEISISKKTLYKYFANKEALVKISVATARKSFFDAMELVYMKNLSAIQENFEINKMFKSMFYGIGESTMYQLKKYYSEIYQDILENDMLVSKKLLKGNLLKGIEQGSYRKDINIEACVDFYFSLVLGIYDNAKAQEEVSEIEMEALIYHTRAIATEKGLKELETELNKLI